MTAQPFKNQQTQTKQPLPGGGPAFAPYLETIEFPKNREAILQAIEENTENRTEDNEAIMEQFRQLPDAVYNNIGEVEKALGEVPSNSNHVTKTEEKDVRASQANRR